MVVDLLRSFSSFVDAGAKDAAADADIGASHLDCMVKVIGHAHAQFDRLLGQLGRLGHSFAALDQGDKVWVWVGKVVVGSRRLTKVADGHEPTEAEVGALVADVLDKADTVFDEDAVLV